MHVYLKNKLPILRRGYKNAFTIVELLIIIVVLGIISAIVFSTINPGEITKRSRDTIRSTDLTALNKVLQIYQTVGGIEYGSPNTVYLSLPDSSATCTSHVLPTLPSGWSYACKPISTYQNVDGTGWVPVDLTSSAIGAASISKLPIDPINSPVEGKFYSYVTGNSWELNAVMEAQNNIVGGSSDKTSSDGGDNPTRLEIGTDLTLAPWSFEFSSFPIANLNSGLPGWRNFAGPTSLSLSSDYSSKNFVKISGYSWYIWQENIPFNPEATYKMTCRLRQSADPTVGGKSAYCGWTGVAADGLTLVNSAGLNTHSSQHYHSLAGTALTLGEAWTNYTGYTKGLGSPAGNQSSCVNLISPCKMHANVRYIRPLFIVNLSSGNGVADIDSILFTKQ